MPIEKRTTRTMVRVIFNDKDEVVDALRQVHFELYEDGVKISEGVEDLALDCDKVCRLFPKKDRKKAILDMKLVPPEPRPGDDATGPTKGPK